MHPATSEPPLPDFPLLSSSFCFFFPPLPLSPFPTRRSDSSLASLRSRYADTPGKGSRSGTAHTCAAMKERSMLLLPLELLPELPEVLRLLPPLLLGAGGAQGRGAGAASPSSGGRGRGTGTGTSSSSGGSRFDTARCSTARCSGSKMRPDPAWAGLSRPHRAGGGREQRPRGAPLFSGQGEWGTPLLCSVLFFSQELRWNCPAACAPQWMPR